MKIYDEAGRLSEEGKKAYEELRAMVNGLLLMGKNASEVRLISSLILSAVGDLTTDQVVSFSSKKQ